jgi:hypothetical protein
MIYLLIALNVALLGLVIAALVKLRRIDGITQVFARACLQLGDSQISN